MANWDWFNTALLLITSLAGVATGWTAAHRARDLQEQRELEAVAKSLFGQEEESNDAIYEAYYTDRRGEDAIRPGRDSTPRRRRTDR